MVSNVALDANRVELVEQLHWLQPPTLNVASHVLWGREMTLYDAEWNHFCQLALTTHGDGCRCLLPDGDEWFHTSLSKLLYVKDSVQ